MNQHGMDHDAYLNIIAKGAVDGTISGTNLLFAATDVTREWIDGWKHVLAVEDASLSAILERVYLDTFITQPHDIGHTIHAVHDLNTYTNVLIKAARDYTKAHPQYADNLARVILMFVMGIDADTIASWDGLDLDIAIRLVANGVPRNSVRSNIEYGIDSDLYQSVVGAVA
jgi:hypothetical protein